MQNHAPAEAVEVVVRFLRHRAYYWHQEVAYPVAVAARCSPFPTEPTPNRSQLEEAVGVTYQETLLKWVQAAAKEMMEVVFEMVAAHTMLVDLVGLLLVNDIYYLCNNYYFLTTC